MHTNPQLMPSQHSQKRNQKIRPNSQLQERMLATETNPKRDKASKLTTPEPSLMALSSTHQETEARPLISQSVQDKSSNAGMKDSSNLKEDKRQSSTAHQTWLMDQEELEVSFHQMQLSSLMSNLSIFEI